MAVPQDLMIAADAGLLNSLCFDRLHEQQSFQRQNVSCRSGLGEMVFGSVCNDQQREIDQHIIRQYEGLRSSLQEQRQGDMATILNLIEVNSCRLVAEKDEELASARKRAAQLELILQRTDAEQQQWRKLALDRETHAIHLSNTLREMLQGRNDSGGDAESRCEAGCGESRAVGLCRGCGWREACVVLLPCRHLCSCLACESMIDSCPACRCFKLGAIQAFIF